MRKSAILLALTTLLLAGSASAQKNSSYYWKQGYNPLERGSRATAPSTNTILYFDGTQFVNASFSAYLTALGGVTLTELGYLDIATLGTGAASKAIVLDASGDYTYPASATIVMPSGGSFSFSSGSTFNVAGTFQVGGVAVTATAAEYNYIDLTTLGTGAASKAIVLDASGDYTYPASYTGVIPSGGTETFQSGSTLAVAGTFTVDAVTVNKNALSLPGRAKVTICGDATTVNNNTVYYGPSQDIQAGYGRTCDITAAGNTTEATADEPAFTDTAFQILSMNCLNDQDANADISFTTRSAAAATTPSMTCTITDGERSCTTNAGTTTAIASGATLAIAVASSSDVGTAQWMCELDVAF